ncbi:MAG: L,D-transpeptidase family protein [Planctomycetes bacterium]|nr:L,D-transpeptidase family protein [Planctomycetota bacterium]
MILKRIGILLVLFVVVAAAWPFRGVIRSWFAEEVYGPVVEHVGGGQVEPHGYGTVADRLRQYGGCVRGRLEPCFAKVGIDYPPAKVVLVGIKDEKKLEVWASGDGGYRLVRTYRILGASGRLGPKLREGDCQVPEELYRIESLNPNSRFHLPLRVNYPNGRDRARAKAENRTNLGGDIMIHGGRASIGCLAMGDEAAEDLFILAAEMGAENVSVILCPVDFRRNEMPKLSYSLPGWTDDLYERIRERLSGFVVE